MSNRIQFKPETRTGPCLKNCGQIATYELVDPETERQKTTCPSCGVYEASIDEMEDGCDAD